MKRPAVFLDRDGTLINERGYLGDPNRIRFYSSAAPALRHLKKLGFRLVIVSNQSGVARGYFTERTLRRIDARLRRMLRKKGAVLDGSYYCLHMPDAGCACRKPSTGLARRAARELGLDLKRSFVIGDQWGDMKLAENIGARGVLVMTGAGRSSRRRAGRLSSKITANVATAAEWIEKHAAAFIV